MLSGGIRSPKWKFWLISVGGSDPVNEPEERGLNPQRPKTSGIGEPSETCYRLFVRFFYLREQMIGQHFILNSKLIIRSEWLGFKEISRRVGPFAENQTGHAKIGSNPKAMPVG